MWNNKKSGYSFFINQRLFDFIEIPYRNWFIVIYESHWICKISKEQIMFEIGETHFNNIYLIDHFLCCCCCYMISTLNVNDFVNFGCTTSRHILLLLPLILRYTRITSSKKHKKIKQNSRHVQQSNYQLTKTFFPYHC